MPSVVRPVVVFVGIVALVSVAVIWHLRPVDAEPAASLETASSEQSPVVFSPDRPSEMSVADFEGHLFEFLNEQHYIERGWKRDKGVRDTGPYIDGVYYGTHPAVRAFYSPEVIEWLENGRQGPLPDGAMIIKEQYAPPAARHDGKSDEELWESLESWTVMVKDSQGSHDGWFWSNPGKGQEVVDNHADFSHPLSGFGLYCVRCHASTHSPGTEANSPANEYTFSSLRNIEGYPGEPILFRVDDSWRKEEKSAEGDTATLADKADGMHPNCNRSGTLTPCDATMNDQFVRFYNQVRPVKLENTEKLPPVTHDWVVRHPRGRQDLATSNQCMSCHAGLLKPYGPTMFVTSGEEASYGAEGWNVSPYGEWRWTPMGLAGRDPVFHAQLEGEVARLQEEFKNKPKVARELGEVLEDTCLKCHGAMGRHQFHADGGGDDGTFDLDQVDDVARDDQPIGTGNAKYAALARDGISCLVCHRMQPRPQPAEDDRPYLQYYLETSVTGNLYFGPADEVYGPFKDDEITAYPMEHALGITPKHSDYIQHSQLCGSCHTVTLPSVDRPIERAEKDELNDAQVVRQFANFHHHVEQATYLEWLNSEFENEFHQDNPNAQSCQQCHMSRGLHDADAELDVETLATRMAIVQDTTYPDAENLATPEKLTVRMRESGYARHNFSGLNVFLLELFDQFDDVLGVRTQDYMTGSNLDIEHARDNFLLTAREKTADVTIESRWADGELLADVTVTNKAGHRFPTGVGFRRAFLELSVRSVDQDGQSQVIWSSGRTNSLGVLVDDEGQPLASEFFQPDEQGKETYQRHYEEISSPKQVQIYESLICDAKDIFTTSFIHGCTTRKDNRLLPRGWSKEGPGEALSGRYLEATYPKGGAAEDADYADGSGSDRTRYRIALPDVAEGAELQVEAQLYYQAMPPYFLKHLFSRSPEGPATQRLYYLLSHLELEGTAIEDWKLPVASDSNRVRVD